MSVSFLKRPFRSVGQVDFYSCFKWTIVALLVGVWIFHPLLVAKFSGTFPKKSALALVSIGCFFGVSYLCASGVQNKIFRRALKTIIFLFGIIPPLAIVVYESIEGLLFGTSTIVLILQSNPGESFHYLLSRSDYLTISAIVLFLIFSIPICFDRQSKTNRTVLIAIAVISILFVTVCKVGGYYKKIDLRQSYHEAKELLSFKTGTTDLVAKRNSYNQKLHIVVIGESANRSHLSLYGYKRETTPKMNAAFAACRHCAFSSGAWASDKLTTFALKYALTNENQYSTSKATVSIIDVLNMAGFNTVWISNQEYAKSVGQPYNLIGTSAKIRYFLDARPLAFLDDRPLDDKVVPTLKNILAELRGDTVVFIHLMGSHGPYAMRFPRQYAKWKDLHHQNTLDAYDNSILYTDRILELLMKVSANADSFIYFSDHGELPGVGRDHLDTEMFKIPLVAFFKEPSDQQRRLLSNMRNNVPFSNDCLFDTLIGMYDISSNFYDQSLDLSSTAYRFKSEEDLLVNSGRNKIKKGKVIPCVKQE